LKFSFEQLPTLEVSSLWIKMIFMLHLQVTWLAMKTAHSLLERNIFILTLDAARSFRIALEQAKLSQSGSLAERCLLTNHQVRPALDGALSP
jgi:hypothetical protein